MPDLELLRSTLHRIDGRPYPAYKDLRGRAYRIGQLELLVDHVQGDPFAAPSRLRVRASLETTGFPDWCTSSRSRDVAFRDAVARKFSRAAERASQRRGSGKGGRINGERLGQEILDRSAVALVAGHLEIRLRLGLPAQGRRILGRAAAQMLSEDLIEAAESALFANAWNLDALERHLATSEDADWLRGQLTGHGLVAFVADGAVLPRRSGVDDRPLREGALPFQSPASLHTTFQLPNAGSVSGMGIPRGVTLIVGGGFHGKSTLLRAIERGVYNHLPGDGREQVVTVRDAVKVRSEDGRAVAGVDLSPFINHLPGGRDTTCFTTANASGSTSQAAGILEALEVGASALLLDEDTSATNFMIRDQRMQELIAADKEPITPFLDKVRQLVEEHAVSTILVMGGSGDYFDVADTVIAMEEYAPSEVTDQAKAIAARMKSARVREGGREFGPLPARRPDLITIDPSDGRRDVRIRVRDVATCQFGREDLDLSCVEQLVDEGQTHAIVEALALLRSESATDASVRELAEQVTGRCRDGGFDWLSHLPRGEFAEFRPAEFAAALNRLRSLGIPAPDSLAR